jgi:prephenate dehydratase
MGSSESLVSPCRTPDHPLDIVLSFPFHKPPDGLAESEGVHIDSIAKIGYMGIPFSNSEEMAMTFSKKFDLRNVELVPLMSAKNVLDALSKGEIDYGVLAIENKTAGRVIESEEAKKNVRDLLELDRMWSPIHHCVFKKNKEDKVVRLVSHIQALQQSAGHLRELYPGAELQECEDTAYAAEMLSKGMLPEGSAAVCRKDAGVHYGLFLDNENVEDDPDNMTLFSLVRLE